MPVAIEVNGSPASRLHLLVLRAAGLPLRVTGGRGSGSMTRVLSRIFPPGSEAIVRPFGDEARLVVRLDDAYWVGYALGFRRYEPSLHHVLDRILTPEVAFIDCGANIGWWSVFATATGRAGQTVAVEPAAALFNELRRNAILGGDRFHCVRAAIWNRSGETLDLATDPKRHAWGTVEPALRDQLCEDGFAIEPVPSVTVDDIVALHTDGRQSFTVVKLDVEGAERQAARGAEQTLESGLLIFEDHGRDPSAAVTSFVVEEIGLDVFLCGPGGSLAPLDVRTVRNEMRDPTVGYNFVAARRGGRGHSAALALTDDR